MGLRRHLHDAAVWDGTYWLGQFIATYEMGDSESPDPMAFGKDVADFDIGEPLGAVVDILRTDREGIGWWGTLGLELPTRS